MASHELEPRLRVVIAGGGIAGLETALALGELAPERTAVTVLAPNSEFVDRAMTVREPFGYARAGRYPLATIVEEAGAELLTDELAWVDPARRVTHTAGGREIPYDALVLAMGARMSPRYEHAITIDDRNLDETLHGLIQDLEGGYIASLAFLAPGRMAWPLPLYELALMTSGRAFDADVALSTTIVTPEDSPLAIFGAAASATVSERLRGARIDTVCSAYAEVPRSGEVVINPGDRHLRVDRVIALPELYGPGVRGIPLAEHGFIRVDAHGAVLDLERVYAAGDVTDFPVKQGSIGAQQADAVAQAVAALAGAAVTPEPFQPVIHGMLLTDEQPLYLSARITGGHGYSSNATEEAPAAAPKKLAARYLTPCLDRLSRATATA